MRDILSFFIYNIVYIIFYDWESIAMELRLVNENKLKITLTNEDMALLDITYEEMDYPDDIGTRRVLWEILDEAKRQTGFDAGSGKEKLYIKVHPDKGGGCFMYITKGDEPQVYHKSDPHTYEKKFKSKLYTGVKKKRVLYMFHNSENLLEACNQLNLTGYSGKSDIFADESRYYLYIEDNREPWLDLISEYGVLINNPYFGFYLDEHTKKIMSSDAVKMFSEVFK